ncbi:MAG: hypothetical protein JWO06_4031 [Bacteroidota bacterium]|nr:hypothetical protein [Bacteroidota bacterium]
MKATESSPFTKNEVYVNEIEFRSKDEVYLFGFLHHCGKFYETQYLVSRNDLQTLLSQNRAGVEILWQIENLFVHPHAAPASLNLIDLFGTTQVFESLAIKLDVPVSAGNEPRLISSGLLFIEEIIPFSGSRQNSF